MTYIAPTKALAHLDRLVAWREGHKPPPVTVEWDLSNRCYLGCEACHFAHTHVRGPWAAVAGRPLPMAYDQTGDLADTGLVKRGLAEMAEAGVQGLVWSGGGEPTTHPDWPEIVAHAARLGLQQGMYTAGGLLTAETGAVLSAAATWVVVSLDALDAEIYGREKRVTPALFDKACAGIRHLTGGRAVVGVSFLLHAGNFWQAPLMVHLARSLGADYTTFRPRIDTAPDAPGVATTDRGWVTDALPVLRTVAAEADVECDPSRFVAYRDWTGHGYSQCHGIKLNATVTPDGRVWVCLQRRGVGGSEVGDLRVESFRDLWARHPGVWTDFTGCRMMCRLHLVNQVLAEVFVPRAHTAFV